MADSQRIEDLRRRVQKDPASIAFAQLAEECRRAGNFQESVDVCRAGLELHPGYLSARVTLGRALIELNDLDTALAELEYVLKSAPENLAAIRGVAEIHHRQGSFTLALAQYRAALALARNDPDLQRTVDELARQVEPPLPPASADGLSFEQLQDEFLQNLPAPPTPSPAIAAAPASAGHATPAPVAPAFTAPAPPPAPAANSPAMLTPVVDAPPPPVPPASASYYAAPPPEIHLAPPPRPVAVEPLAVAEPPQDHAERAQALQLVAVLEQWLDAIHVSRAQPRA
jgi:tetratricopeptide (TPR) repeat protein